MKTLALFVVLGLLMLWQSLRWKRKMLRAHEEQREVLSKLTAAIEQKKIFRCLHEKTPESQTCRKCGCVVIERPGAAA